MKPSVLLLLAFALVVAMPLAEQPARAQAATGPQGGPPPSQQQQKPTPPQTPPTGQQPPQSDVSISVDVPVVTLDVVAATQHGDLIPNLKKENFRVLDEGVPQAITNFGPTEAPITMVRSEEHTSELQSHSDLVCRLLLEKKKKKHTLTYTKK